MSALTTHSARDSKAVIELHSEKQVAGIQEKNQMKIRSGLCSQHSFSFLPQSHGPAKLGDDDGYRNSHDG